MGKTLVPAQDPETGSPGVLSPGAVISPATTASETITLEPIITAEDEAAMAQGDAMMMGQFTKSRAGSYREGTLRCILDIAETYPDRPAGMHDIARGQCRSLSEDPRRARSFGDKTAKGKPRSFRLMDTIRETRLGEDLPITHVLFLPKEENLPSAPVPCAGKSDPSDEEVTTKPAPGTSSSSTTPVADEPAERSRRSRRSVSRIRYGHQVVKVVRLGDPKAGFGRRAFSAPGKYQLHKTRRKISPPVTMTPRVPGTTGMQAAGSRRRQRIRWNIVKRSESVSGLETG